MSHLPVNCERVDLDLITFLRGFVAKSVNENEDYDGLVLRQFALDCCEDKVDPWLHVWRVLTVKLRNVLVNLRSM